MEALLYAERLAGFFRRFNSIRSGFESRRPWFWVGLSQVDVRLKLRPEERHGREGLTVPGVSRLRLELGQHFDELVDDRGRGAGVELPHDRREEPVDKLAYAFLGPYLTERVPDLLVDGYVEGDLLGRRVVRAVPAEAQP